MIKPKSILELIDNIYNTYFCSQGMAIRELGDDLKEFLLDKKKELEGIRLLLQHKHIIDVQIVLLNSLWGSELKEDVRKE